MQTPFWQPSMLWLKTRLTGKSCIPSCANILRAVVSLELRERERERERECVCLSVSVVCVCSFCVYSVCVWMQGLSAWAWFQTWNHQLYNFISRSILKSVTGKMHNPPKEKNTEREKNKDGYHFKLNPKPRFFKNKIFNQTNKKSKYWNWFHRIPKNPFEWLLFYLSWICEMINRLQTLNKFIYI